MPGGCGECGAAAFEAGDPLFENGDGRVRQARIDVAEIVQVEERGGVIDIVEHVGGRLIDRRRTGARHRVGGRAGMDGTGLETIGDVVRRRRPLARAPRQRRFGRPVANDAAIDPAPRKLTAQPPELDLRAAVHDDLDPSLLGRRCRGIIADTELHPHHLGANRDRVLDDRGRVSRGAEDIDHVDRLGNVAQRCIDLFAEQHLPGDAGVDRDHPIAFALQIFHHEVARPVPIRRGADHRDGLDALQDRAKLRVGVGDRVEAAHGSLIGAVRASCRILG